MKTKNKKINKQRLKNDREKLAGRRATLKAYGGKMTIFYYVPGELDLAKRILCKAMTDPFSLKRKIEQLDRRKMAPPKAPTSRKENGQLEFPIHGS